MIDIKKLRHYGLLLFMFICPVIYNNGVTFDLRDFQERAFQLISICLVALFIGNIWIGSFLILNVFVLLYNDPAVGLQQVLNILLGSLLFMISRSYFKKTDFMPYARILVWLLALNLIWMILQSSGIDPLYIAQNASGVPQIKATFRDFSGLFGIKMANGIFIGMVMPILASINLWLVPFLLIPLYYCRASIAILAVFVSMSFYLFHTNRRIFNYFVVVGLAGATIYTFLDLKDDSHTFKSRFPVWHSAVRYTLSHPLGYGPDSYRNYNAKKNFLFYSDYDYNHAIVRKLSEDTALFQYYEMDNGAMYSHNHKPFKNNTISWWDNPHNEYIQQFFEYGFIGLFLLVGLIREMFYRFKFAVKSKELIVITASLLVYFVSGLGHFPLHIARLACLFGIFLGAFFAKTDEIYQTVER